MSSGYIRFTILLFFACQAITGKNMTSQPQGFLPGIQSALPASWNCQITAPPDSMVWPRGIFKPSFTASFVDSVHLITDCHNMPDHPSLQICFYTDTLRDTIEKIIKEEEIFSWCIPIKYMETNRYFIVTSPCYINNGCYTPEAKKLIAPLDSALARYFNNEGIAGLEIKPDSLSVSANLFQKYNSDIDTIVIVNTGDRSLSIDTIKIKFLNGVQADFRCGVNCNSLSDYNYNGWCYGYSLKTLRYLSDSLYMLQDSLGNPVGYSISAHDSLKFPLSVFVNCPICNRMPSFPSTTLFRYDFVDNNGTHVYFTLSLKNSTAVFYHTGAAAIHSDKRQTSSINLQGKKVNAPYSTQIITRNGKKKLEMKCNKPALNQ